jgi:hypothetical protein
MRGHEAVVALPYTRLRPEVCQPLSEQGHDVTFVDVSGSDEDYWQLMADLWAQAETFVIVEHDVIVRDGAIDELVECEQDWCGFPVSYCGTEYAGLACTKFTAGLIARYPDALERVAEIEDADHKPKHWCRLDGWLKSYVLEPGGERMHVHGPVLEHVRGGGGVVLPAHAACR